MKTIEQVIEDAKKKAVERFGVLNMRYCKITDNPYPRKHPNHVIWHNAFYDARK